MVPATVHTDHWHVGVLRRLRTVGLVALWAAVVANLAEVLPVTTPPRYDWLVAAAAAVATVTALYGKALLGSLRVGEQIGRRRQAARRPARP